MAEKAKSTFRLKKDKFYRERTMRAEAKKRELERKAAKKNKRASKAARRAEKTEKRYEDFWLWKWCCPCHFTGHRRVTKVVVEYHSKSVFVWFEGGQSYRVYPQNGSVWPVETDLDILEVTYNEKGNILSEVHDQGSGYLR